MRIVKCKTNHLNAPLGYRLDNPVFSYIVEDAKGDRQTLARILVSCHADMSTPVYDTGLSAGINSLAHVAEIELLPRTRYYWTVTVRTNQDEEATSDVNCFETGKMQEPWDAQWLTCAENTGRHPVFFRKINLSKPVVQARLYICGLGLYEASIGGERISDEYLAPYCNNYAQWLQYQTYDVTKFVRDGAEIAVLLGNGWYKGRFGHKSRPGDAPYYGDEWKLIAELRVLHQDGSETILGTDESWQVRKSGIIASSIYDGEVYDASLEATAPEAALLAKPPSAPLCDRLSLPVRIHETFVPVEIIHTPAGEIVLDMGQNFAGIFRLRVHRPRGTRVFLQFGEILQGGNFYRDNLRSALAEYTFISDGNPHVLQPHFTFYGYRYVKVEGIPDLCAEDFTGLALYSDIPRAGTMRTGNALVNQLISNVEWSMKGNFIDVPTDCPQRDERMGWTGDAQVFSPTACYLRDSYAFFRKYLFDMESEQRTAGGKVPNVVPSFGDEGTSAVWGDAACIIPWNLYLFYGDLTILQQQYGSMKAWVDYVTSINGKDHGWRKVFHFGDWLALDNMSTSDQTMGATDRGFIADVYYAYSARLVSRAANLLDKAEEAEVYGALANRITSEIRDEYYSVTGRSCIGTQTALLLTLHFGLVDQTERTRSALRRLLCENGGKLQTGFVGTPLLCNVLSQEGMGDLAYKLLLNEEYPGWLYEVKLGATTIWERWNSVLPDGSISSTGMNSLNHYSYGSIVEWLYRHAAGITPIESEPGFRKTRIAPMPRLSLGSMEVEYRSQAGTYRVAWTVSEQEEIDIKIHVPFGGTAEVYLPYADQKVLERFDSRTTNGVCHLIAGEYEITYRANQPLRLTLSSADSVKTLLGNPKAKRLLSEMIPGLERMPVSMHSMPLRELASRFGQGGLSDRLSMLDQALEKIID